MTSGPDAQPWPSGRPPGLSAGWPTRIGRCLPDRLWVPALAAGLLALVFVGALLVRADGDVSLLVHAGPPWTTSEPGPAGTGPRGSLTVQSADDAFDGQFFYRLGVAPWSEAPREAGVTFDLPALRNARWGYGALAWVGSAGDPDLVPWSLVGLNVLAAAAVGAVGGGLARASGRHAAWGLLFVLWPGFAYSLSLDTSELVASAFLLAGLLALRHRRWAGAATLFTAALLTRDTTAVVPFGVLATGAWLLVGRWLPSPTPARGGRGGGGGRGPTTGDGEDHGASEVDAVQAAGTAAIGPVGSTADQPGDRTSAAPWGTAPAGAVPLALAGGIPLVVFGVWQLVQRARFDALPLTSSGDNNLSAPLAGLVDQLGTLLPPSGGEELFRLLSAIGVVTLLVAAGWCWRSSAAPLAERLAWVPAVAVVVVLNAYLWSGATAFMRAATEAGLLSILVVLGARGRHADRLVALMGIGLAGLWALTAVAQLTKLA